MQVEQPSERAFEIVSEWLRTSGEVANGPRLYTMCQFADFVLARAALSHPSTGQWMLIESAPKDGTKILICNAFDADGKPMGKSFGLFVHRAAWWESEGWVVYNSQVCEQPAFFDPTHWMPIPPPPQGDKT